MATVKMIMMVNAKDNIGKIKKERERIIINVNIENIGIYLKKLKNKLDLHFI